MKIKNGRKNVTIGYIKHNPPPFGLRDLSLSVKLGAHMTFASNTGDNEVAHIWFLSEGGGSLQSFRVVDFSMTPDIKGEASKSIDRLFNILRLCPLLKECTINNASSVLASHHESKFPSLNKLSILNVINSKSLGFLNSLSLNLSNLCAFSLALLSTDDNNTDPIVIDMPHSSLDSLTCHDNTSDTEVYIKLKTERGLRYYSGSIHELIPVDKSRYLLAAQNTRFDINCKDLKEFKITGYFFRHQHNWIF
ncbi:hypothetical protein EDC94DRAFT_675103 [Helicostylum pulchrum]|nr:hypothetical protein EDC94DRAFT_675103 [Helicostylum pulchrum]